jgi:hypothetical protein
MEGSKGALYSCSQTSYFEVLSVHDDVIEAKQDREPVLDHRILTTAVLRARSGKATFWCVEHDGNDASKHGNRKKTDLLIFANFTKVGDAHRQVGKGAISDDGGKVFLVQSSDNLKRRARYPFCGQQSVCEARSPKLSKSSTCQSKL